SALQSHTNDDPHTFPTRRSSDLALMHTVGVVGNVNLLFAFYFPVVIVGRTVKHIHLVNGADGVGVNVSCVVSQVRGTAQTALALDRKSTRLNSSHVKISYAVFCW